ncbi:PDZ and LIM domain protein 1 [Plakobranchus ocellatus]|uniref:PDZ and LIM domain protein 1 n=1 Tax=Plakobranchus ocellatus TaxID=259542 RepID=A0AAV4D2G3_9GAST|nr:PDZ and LIM domain protein 1 [Plakobranchus ocellatus]
MDVNDAPVGTVISGTGQVLEQEVSVADPSGIEISTTSPTQSAGMNPTTSTTSLLSQTPSKAYRSVSPFQPVAATTTPTAATTQAAGMSPTTSATSMFSQTSTKAYRPVSPFQPVSTSTTTTAATTESAGMSPTTTTTSMFSQTPSKGYRSVSPFQPVSATTTTTAAVTQPAGMSPTTSAPSMFSQAPTKAYRSVSPFQPVSTATSAAAAAPTHPAPYNASADDEEETPGPIMQSRSFQKVQQELEAQDEAESNNNSVNIRGFKSVSAPVAKPPSEKPQQPSMRCGGCDMLATGVIVKASGVPYHVACFKCTSCSMNLKQKGFFVVEGKLYCETHAKRHAKPPGPDMVAVATYR